MFKAFAALTAAAVLAGLAPTALAEPDTPAIPEPAAANNPPPPAEGELGPPPDNGIVGSEPPTRFKTPDGWELTVAAEDETQLPIPPLTTALSSREYLTGGTFMGSVKGRGTTTLKGGTIEAGYQIGCGIELSGVRLTGNIGISSSISASGLGNISVPIVGNIEIRPKPGEVINVSVTKKKFKGTQPRVTIKDIHIKIDGCVGQSFLRSYAILTSSGSGSEDIVAYYGVTKSV
ncbi:MspA family porin [Mycobacteroides immunogenum]|uniref:MspA protein n=1 Tax=Mycobacteroides immunogenum TaxID=83262 RepID=A0A7V8LS58_9MYCO|nr:MspA family porin [Mycobacteroides immunogenum]AMT70320.1 MspA protein [Mycobacteroides immunogenum]ANO03386.1 MspA protein [Mycobacteroides immunogenum]KIU42147.1 MspA protein [Mycobacteroides immunogenum]KPG13407.1 MspA protein [Mycobacteroides immunogenum]KPG14674.1 MspA protein [Mycobacteroides immunogenum]